MSFPLRYYYVFVLITLISCNSKKNTELNLINNNSKTNTVVKKNYDVNGVIKSQFLITNSDTVHKLLYDDEGRIIIDDGCYAYFQTTILNKNKYELKITIHSVDVDSLIKIFILSQSSDDYTYTPIFAEEIDSTSYSKVYNFNDNIVNIIYSMSYVKKNTEVVIEFDCPPLIVNFNKETVDIPSTFLQRMKKALPNYPPARSLY
jgi:hypothetical protein